MNAQQLKNSILQEAIEGRLVPQDPNDEPASVLLDKIRAEKKRLVKEGKLKKKDLEEIPISEDEIPFDIPESWQWCKLGTITTVLGGKRIPAGRKLTQENTGHIYIRVSDMKEETVSTDNLLYVPEDIFSSISRYIINKEDVYITVAGTIGKIGKIPPELDGANLTENADRIVFNNISQDWLIRCLQSPFIQVQITDVTTKVGQPKLAILRIQSLLIPLPPLAEQKRIVAKIEELLPKVEKYGKAQDELNKLNEELPERLKKSILQEAIEGRLVPQDSNEEPASVLLDKIRAEKKRLVKEGKLKKKDLEETPISEDEIPFVIPESWEWVRLGEISTYAYTKKKINATKADPNIWGLDLEDIEKGGRLLCIKSVGERKAVGDKTCFLEGDILYSKLRPYLLKILIAPQDGICTSEIIPFTCYADVCKGYIVSLLKSAYVDDYINSATFGVKMPRVATETMTSLVLPLPPLAEQKRIVEKIEQLMKEIDKLK